MKYQIKQLITFHFICFSSLVYGGELSLQMENLFSFQTDMQEHERTSVSRTQHKLSIFDRGHFLISTDGYLNTRGGNRLYDHYLIDNMGNLIKHIADYSNENIEIHKGTSELAILKHSMLTYFNLDGAQIGKINFEGSFGYISLLKNGMTINTISRENNQNVFQITIYDKNKNKVGKTVAINGEAGFYNVIKPVAYGQSHFLVPYVTGKKNNAKLAIGVELSLSK